MRFKLIIDRVFFIKTETFSQIQNCLVIAGLSNGRRSMNDVFKINLHRPQEISTERQIPTTMQKSTAAAVYCNTLYITGIGAHKDEIWNYISASVWMKCAFLDSRPCVMWHLVWRCPLSRSIFHQSLLSAATVIPIHSYICLLCCDFIAIQKVLLTICLSSFAFESLIFKKCTNQTLWS